MPSEDAFGSDQEPGFQDIYWRDEILELMFWLSGEGLFEDVAPDDLWRSLETDPGRSEERLEQLVQEGYLDPSSREGGTVPLERVGD
jgi:hypothetical protein